MDININTYQIKADALWNQVKFVSILLGGILKDKITFMHPFM